MARRHIKQAQLAALMQEADALHPVTHFFNRAKVSRVRDPLYERIGRLVSKPSLKRRPVVAMIGEARHRDRLTDHLDRRDCILKRCGTSHSVST
jgi:hypothetical protein